MRRDRIFAIALITLCLISAFGNWLGGSIDSSSGGLSSALPAEVAVFDIYGGISDSPAGGPFSSSSGVSSNAVIAGIREAREDGVKAILLRINSPGGTAAASQAIYDELMRARKETDIKIVATLGDVAASGGYFVASAADHIVANPTTVTGSIGVIIRTQNLSSLLDKVGVENKTFQSGQYKDILSPYRDPKPGETEILQGIVTESYEQFLKSIVEGRKMPLEKLKPLADGRIFTGIQAQKVGLADSLGNYADALDKVAELAKIKGEPRVKPYGKGSGVLQQLLNDSLSTSLEQWLPGYQQQAQFARWQKVPLALME
ncbi:MAG: signal peptide peptidase SppA [Thermosynechococcaceae cyanobacterium]